MKIVSYARREGASWSAREDRELRAGARSIERAKKAKVRDVAWTRLARSFGRTVRAVRSRWNVLQACARLCACKKKRKS